MSAKTGSDDALAARYACRESTGVWPSSDSVVPRLHYEPAYDTFSLGYVCARPHRARAQVCTCRIQYHTRQLLSGRLGGDEAHKRCDQIVELPCQFPPRGSHFHASCYPMAALCLSKRDISKTGGSLTIFGL